MSEWLNLCGNCWGISHPNGWWAFNIEEGIPEDTNDDPQFYRCPTCGYDHRDTDDDPGVWSAPQEELERTRLDEDITHRRVRGALSELDKEIAALDLDLGDDLPLDVRRRLLMLACSLNDYVFYVRRKRQRDDLSDDPQTWMYFAVEVESGGIAWGITPRDALERYFYADVLDLPRGASNTDSKQEGA